MDVETRLGRTVGVGVRMGVALTGAAGVSGVWLPNALDEPVQAVNKSNNKRKTFLIFGVFYKFQDTAIIRFL